MAKMTRNEIEDARDHLKAWFANQSVERHTFNKICDQAVIAARPQPSPHPWQAFLDARANAIDWMHADGESDFEIAASLSMDSAEQVYMIRTRERREPQLHDDGN